MKNSMNQKVAALDKVMQICNAHGASYNPGNAALAPTALAALLQQAQEKMKAVSVAEAAYIMAIAARAESLRGIPRLAVRVTRLVEAMNVSVEELEHVKMIKRRLFSPGSTKTKSTTAEATPQPFPKKERSASKLSAASKTENFQLLVNLVESISAYRSNDPEMQIEGLRNKLVEIQALNLAVMQTKTTLGFERDQRDKVIEGPSGVMEITRKAKNFIRSKFGVFSPESNRTRPTNM